MGAGMPKAFMPLAGRPMLAWSLVALDAAPEVDGIVVAVPPGMEEDAAHLIGESVSSLRVVPGGATRQRSVMAALGTVPSACARVLVHDAARPLLTPALVARVLEGLEDADGAIAASPMADTLKLVDEANLIVDTPDRAGLWRAETPQAFDATVLRRAFAAADGEALDRATDCAALVQAVGGRVRVVPSLTPNLKVTTPADLEVAARLLGGADVAAPGTVAR
jgi:2-C-methyl-D-erythritol 4-phosphate cytidylyltransferase